MTCSLGLSPVQRDGQPALHRGHRGGRPGRAALRHRLGARGQGQRLPRPLVQEGLRHPYIQVRCLGVSETVLTLFLIHGRLHINYQGVFNYIVSNFHKGLLMMPIVMNKISLNHKFY